MERIKNDFILTSIQDLKHVVKVHTDAGFENIPDSLIYRRLNQLILFLQEKNLTIKTLINNEKLINEDFKLNNFDLIDEGFFFLKNIIDKWINRLYKDKGEKKELEFLNNWYDKFISLKK